MEELKAYFGFMVLMGINQLPEIRDYTGQRILPFITHQSQTASHVIDSRDRMLLALCYQRCSACSWGCNLTIGEGSATYD